MYHPTAPMGDMYLYPKWLADRDAQCDLDSLPSGTPLPSSFVSFFLVFSCYPPGGFPFLRSDIHPARDATSQVLGQNLMGELAAVLSGRGGLSIGVGGFLRPAYLEFCIGLLLSRR